MSKLTKYEKNKESIYRWREQHRDEYKDYMLRYARQYREDEEHKQYFRDMRLKNYYWKKESEIFRNIMIPEN